MSLPHETRPLSSINHVAFEQYLHQLRRQAQECHRDNVYYMKPANRIIQRIIKVLAIVPVEDLAKFGVTADDINNAHIGESYPVPAFINQLLAKFPAYGKVVLDFAVPTSPRIVGWEIYFHTNVRLLDHPSKMAIRAHL
jgi:hypothetical protein